MGNDNTTGGTSCVIDGGPEGNRGTEGARREPRTKRKRRQLPLGGSLVGRKECSSHGYALGPDLGWTLGGGFERRVDTRNNRCCIRRPCFSNVKMRFVCMP